MQAAMGRQVRDGAALCYAILHYNAPTYTSLHLTAPPSQPMAHGQVGQVQQASRQTASMSVRPPSRGAPHRADPPHLSAGQIINPPVGPTHSTDRFEHCPTSGRLLVNCVT
jgi:hypothetical protein